MRRRLGSVFVVLLMLAGVMVLPAGASASGLVVVERDESAPVGVEAFVRVGVPDGASGVRTEVPDGEDWVESEVGELEADGNYSILLSFGDGAVGVFTYRVVADVAGEVVSSEVVEFVRTAVDTPE